GGMTPRRQTRPAPAAGGEPGAPFTGGGGGPGPGGRGGGPGWPAPPLSAGAVRRADELALPLLGVPYSVPFTAVVRAVADANDREEALLLGRGARLYELLRASVIAGGTGPAVFRKLGEGLGGRVYSGG